MTFEHQTFNLKKIAMKKFMFVLFLCVAFVSPYNSSFAQSSKPYPIPSYNILVNGIANFQESMLTCIDMVRGKSTANVRTICNKSLISSNITVYVYSLDGLDCYGPFFMSGGQTLTVEIDDRVWGVAIQSVCDVPVDVWIDRGGLASEVGSGAK